MRNSPKPIELPLPYVANIAHHRKLDERGQIAAAAIVIVPCKTGLWLGALVKTIFLASIAALDYSRVCACI